MENRNTQWYDPTSLRDLLEQQRTLQGARSLEKSFHNDHMDIRTALLEA